MNIEALEKIKHAVHQPLNFDDYNSTLVQDNTNCFSHAIGSTVPDDRSLYRLGMISGKKTKNEAYSSADEIKSLFLSDLSVLELNVREIAYVNKNFFLSSIDEMNLDEKMHIILLYMEQAFNYKILDFHFLRFDKEHGWTEKRPNSKPVFLDTRYSWPTYMMYPVGAFIIEK